MSFSDTITTIGQSCNTCSEAEHFCFWALHYSKEVLKHTNGASEKAMAQAIIPVAEYWDEYGLHEDQLAPAIAILRVVSAFCYGEDLAAPLIDRHNALLENYEDYVDLEYSQYYLEKVVPVFKENLAKSAK